MRDLSVLAAVAAALAVGPVARAQPETFHFMQIEQVVGGVGGDPSKQAIQLRMRFVFQNFVTGSRLIAHDAAGQNPVTIIVFPTDVPNGEEGSRILVTSAAMPSPVTPDFTMTNPIPASSLAAGRLTFEDSIGTIYWSLAWGGAAYTGPTTGSPTNTNGFTGQFGPPWPGPLPLVDNRGLLFQGPASAGSAGNATDYALTAGAGVLTNNAGASGALGAACYADCNGDGLLNLADFGCFQTRFATGHPGADCNADGLRNLADFGCFQTRFALGC
jgi:hypothetical protein